MTDPEVLGGSGWYHRSNGTIAVALESAALTLTPELWRDNQLALVMTKFLHETNHLPSDVQVLQMILSRLPLLNL
jgi:hypothetical protein